MVHPIHPSIHPRRLQLLRLRPEVVGFIDLLKHEGFDDVPGMHVDGDDGDHLQSDDMNDKKSHVNHINHINHWKCVDGVDGVVGFSAAILS